jgi:simple sugar transport system ATP-binding protein
VIEEWPLISNAILGFQRIPPINRGLTIDSGQSAELAVRVTDRFNSRHSGLYRSMGELSGGNQQRFVAARAFELDPRIILAFQPTRGLDVDGTTQFFAALRTECGNGVAALVVSFDLDDLLENCDRVLVIHDGRITDPGTKDRHAIGRLMVGAG